MQTIQIAQIEKKMRDEANPINQKYIKLNMPQTFPKLRMKSNVYDQEEVVQNGKYIFSCPQTSYRM